jgi:hypothetical protein
VISALVQGRSAVASWQGRRERTAVPPDSLRVSRRGVYAAEAIRAGCVEAGKGASETFQQPHIAIGHGAQYGEVAAIR